MTPLVSIIIPTYNRAYLIGETLESIKLQTYKNWECIVVDDGSTDNTEGLLQEYIKKDTRFQYYLRPESKPKGANACRNFGFEKSKGEYINWFDSDDIMLPSKLEQQVKILSLNAQSPYCICQSLWYDKENEQELGLRSEKIASTNRLEDYILYKIFWLTTAPLWTRDFIIQNKLSFDEQLHQSQEYDFHIKALNINENYSVLDVPLVIIIMHDGAISTNIFDSDLKMESNLRVKAKIVSHHLLKLSPTGRLKFLEILTVLYKDLLNLKKLNLAYKVLPLLFKTIKQVEVSFMRKAVFCMQLILIYLSFKFIGRGYQILKPLN
nr:glycosyltransferase family A protein [uncultured Psychroserpens sp.]